LGLAVHVTQEEYRMIFDLRGKFEYLRGGSMCGYSGDRYLANESWVRMGCENYEYNMSYLLGSRLSSVFKPVNGVEEYGVED